MEVKEQKKRKRSASAAEIIDSSIDGVGFDGEWLNLVGDPQLTGCWIIWGESVNGKTSFALQLAKYFTKFGKVDYNSMEEGFSLSLKTALKRANMKLCGAKFQVLDKLTIDELKERLRQKRSAKVVFIDSVQYSGLNKITAKELANEFPNKLFVYISHAAGKMPDGRVANAIRYDANVKIRVEGYRAMIQSRYGGAKDQFYTVWEKGAFDYWGAK